MHLFRERVRARLEREVQMMKINESTKGPSIHDVRIGPGGVNKLRTEGCIKCIL